MTNKNLFYFSGFISFGFYGLFILLFFLYLKEQAVQKIDPFSSATILELEIIFEENKNQDKIVQSSALMPNNPKQELQTVEKSASKNLKETADVKSLFANVTTRTQNTKKEAVLNVEKSIVASRYKSQYERESRKENVTVSKLLNEVQLSTTKLSFNENTNHNDPYYSKIYEIIASRWNPNYIVDSVSSKVIITIYSNGRFNYKIVSYSGNSTFDNALISFLTRQTQILYPEHNKGEKTLIEVTFKSKES